MPTSLRSCGVLAMLTLLMLAFVACVEGYLGSTLYYSMKKLADLDVFAVEVDDKIEFLESVQNLTDEDIAFSDRDL